MAIAILVSSFVNAGVSSKFMSKGDGTEWVVTTTQTNIHTNEKIDVFGIVLSGDEDLLNHTVRIKGTLNNNLKMIPV